SSSASKLAASPRDLCLQQEQVDSVEYYALQASEHVECGGQELLKGTVSRRKTRKKKLGLIICLASGFLVVVFVLILS
ncbi:jg27468, partial [Pararge aegeria aegeria]